MSVREFMTSKVSACGENANLATAAAQMWENDCGVLPVVDDDSYLVGVLTDRDICMAVATRHRLACDIFVGEVAARDVQSCFVDDTVTHALDLMRMYNVRRLPVVDHNERVHGMISMNDIILASKVNPAKGEEAPGYVGVMEALKAISGHHALPVNGHAKPIHSKEEQPVHVHDFDIEE